MESPRSTAPWGKRLLLGIGAVLLLLIGGLWALGTGVFEQIWPTKKATSSMTIDEWPVNLWTPEALLEAQHLSRLPKDLLKAPFLADILSDDLVFYYEHNAEKLAVLGTLRRLAFEQHLSIPEQLVADVLDTQAEVALWQAANGKLTYSLVRLNLGAAAQLAQTLAAVLAGFDRLTQPDKQLTLLGDFTLDKNKVKLYGLRYLTNRQLVFGFYQGSLLVASHSAMILGEDQQIRPEAQKLLVQLFKLQQPFKTHFNLPPSDENLSARISLDARFFTFNYQPYVSALAGLRFDLNQEQWQSFLALSPGNHAELFSPSLWANAPADASLCSFLPITTAALKPIIQAQLPKSTLTEYLTGRSFICWFANTPLIKPLIGAELKADSPFTQLDNELGELFAKSIRTPKISQDDANTPTQAAAGTPTAIEGGQQWQKLAPDQTPIATLARRGNFLLFSLDAANVQHGLLTLNKQYPALGDTLPEKLATALYVAPRPLSNLLQKEIRQVASDATLGPLLPKLAALEKKPQVIAQFDASAKASAPLNWVALQWNNL